MAFRSLTVEEFADMLAAKTPAPGGGAVAAVSAAHAAALGAMVLEFTIGKPKFATSDESNASALQRLTNCVTMRLSFPTVTPRHTAPSTRSGSCRKMHQRGLQRGMPP